MSRSEEETKNFLDYLENTADKIIFSDNKNVTLIMGKPGSGKTSLTKFLAGNADLQSEPIDDSFFIVDGEDEISRTFESKTSFPHLYEDQNTVYYDCTGFGDNRNASMDISSAYFIDKIIKHAEFVKIVLTVNYQAVSSDINEKGEIFRSLLWHACNLIQNFDNFDKSIALVVTKVPYDIFSTKSSVASKSNSDKYIIQSIVGFLKKFKEDLKYISPFNENKKMLNRAYKLIDIFLSNNNIFLSLFPKPNQAGPLKQISILQDSRFKITKMIHQNMEFTKNNEKDFYSSILLSSHPKVSTFIDFLDNKIVKNVEKIMKKAEEFFTNEINKSSDMYGTIQYINNNFLMLKKMRSEIKTKNDLLKKLVKGLRHMNISISNYDLVQSLQNFDDFYQFLKIINIETNESPRIWIEPIEETTKFMHNYKLWYEFLDELEKIFSSYKIQKDVQKYNVSNFEDFGQEGKPQGIKVVSTSNLDKFLNNLFRVEKCVSQEILSLKADKKILFIINQILENTLGKAKNVETAKNSLIMKSNFLRLSDIKSNLYKNFTRIELNALKTFFVDTSYENKAGIEFSIIAPYWEVIGWQKIDLSKEIQNNTEIIVNNSLKIDSSKLAGIKLMKHSKPFASISPQIFESNLFKKTEPIFQRKLLNEPILRFSTLQNDIFINGNFIGISKEILNKANLEIVFDSDTQFQNSSLVLNNYKALLLNNAQNIVKKQSLLNFYQTMNENDNITRLYDTYGLLNELSVLDIFFNKLLYDFSFQTFYESLQKRVFKHYDENNLSLLINVYTVILSKICIFEEESNKILALNDIQYYLHKQVETVGKLENLKNIAAIQEHNKNFINIENEIKNAIDFIKSKFLDTFALIDEQMEELLNNLEENLIHNNEVEKIEGFLILQTTFDTYKLIGKMLYSFANYALQIYKGMSEIPLISEKFFEYEFSIPLPLQLDWGKIEEILERATENIQKIRWNKIFLLKKMLNIINKEELICSEQLSEIKELITTGLNYLTKSSDLVDLNFVHTMLAEIEQKLNIQTCSGASECRKMPHYETIEKLKVIIKFRSLPEPIYEAFKENEKHLLKIMDSMNKMSIHQIKNYETEVYLFTISFIDKIKTAIGVFEGEDTENFQIHLDISTWKMHTELADLKTNIKNFKESLGVKFLEQKECFMKMEETMNILSDLYENLHKYHQLQTLEQYIKEIETIKPPISSSLEKEIEQKIKMNIIHMEFKKTIKQFNDFVFPFAEVFTNKIKLSGSDNVKDLVSTVQRIYGNLENLMNYPPYSSYIYFTKFDPQADKKTRPFYIWKNEENNELIRKLFSSEEILLKADISEGLKKNAVKFKDIIMSFRINETEHQKKLDEILNEYILYMTHMGINYYRWNEEIFTISTSKTPFEYKLSEDYSIIKSDQGFLSPYALWKVKLVNRKDINSKIKIQNNLLKFVDMTDLHLIGTGQFVKPDFDEILHLKDFYSFERSLINLTENVAVINKNHQISRRSVKGPFIQFQPTTNAGVGIFSPINNLIKWITKKIFSPKNRFQAQSPIEDFTVNEQYKSLSIEPINFYQKVDSLIILAPVFMNLWQNFFNKKSTNSKIVTVTSNRIQTCKKFIEISLKIITILEKEIGLNVPEVKEYKELLDLRIYEANQIKNALKIEESKLDEFDLNLAAFQTDLFDDFKFNPKFRNLGKTQEFKTIMNILEENIVKLPKYEEKMEFVRNKYCENFDEKELYCPINNVKKMKSYSQWIFKNEFRMYDLKPNLNLYLK